MRSLNYISLFVFVLFANFCFSQNEIEDWEYTEEIQYENFKSQKKYLESNISKEELDWIEWQKIKKSIVEGIPESEYIMSEDGVNLDDNDNPFRKSKNQNRSHWDKKRKNNTHKLKRLSKKERKEREQRKSNESSFRFSKGFGTFLLIAVVILLAFLIFYMFFKNNTTSGRKKIKYNIDNISPTKIPKSELELRLEKSLAEKNYREAIRIYFVFTIKSLVEKNYIIWEKEKTNFSYLNEMRDNTSFKEFENVVTIYEIIWYGERKISKEEFKRIEPKFLNLLKKLDK